MGVKQTNGDDSAGQGGIVWTNEKRRLGDLIPWPRNPRQIKKAEARRLVESVDEFGQVETLAIGPGNDIYNGHQRLNVLMAEHGPEFVVDVRVSNRSLSEKEREKLTVLLHRGAAGSWDFDLLANEFDADELIEWGFEAGELGLGVDGGSGDDAEPQIDRAEELRREWGVEAGQLWRLPSRTPGQEHRLICGDCTDAAVVERVMGGGRAQICFTDPPYGANIEYDTIDDSAAGLVNLIDGFFPLAESYADTVALTPGIANMWRYKRPSWVLAWFYGAGTGSTPWGFTAWQPILVFGKDPKLAAGEGRHPDGFQFMQTKEDMDDRRELSHVVPKPLSVWQRFLDRLSNKHTRIVYDPFSGSGTTLIAAENLSRQCRAVEISPGYCAVALQRYLDTFGIRGELAD